MKIKNNRDNFVKLQVWKGAYSEIFNIRPQEEIVIPHLKDIQKQVVNKFLFDIGNLSVIEEKEEIKDNNDGDDQIKTTTKVEEASKKVEDYTKSSSSKKKQSKSLNKKRGIIKEDKKNNNK